MAHAWTPSRPRGAALLLLAHRIALLVVVCAPGWVWAFTPPAIEGHVTDPSRQLPPAVEQALEAKLAAFRAETTDEVAVFVAPSLGGETIEDVAHATFDGWGLGDEAKDNGVLFVWAPTERKIRIETGRGLGDRLTDVQASRIIREVVTPHFQAERYPAGVEAGVDAILAALRPPGTLPAPTDATWSPTGTTLRVPARWRCFTNLAEPLSMALTAAMLDPHGCTVEQGGPVAVVVLPPIGDADVAQVAAEIDARWAPALGGVPYALYVVSPSTGQVIRPPARVPQLEKELADEGLPFVLRVAFDDGRAVVKAERERRGAESRRFPWEALLFGGAFLASIVASVLFGRRGGSGHGGWTASSSGWSPSSSSSSSSSSFSGGGGSSGGGGASGSY